MSTSARCPPMFATPLSDSGDAKRIAGFTRNAGFTMVELLITIAIASILMSIAVPSFNQMVVGSRLTTQANEFVSAVSFARSEAIKRNATISLCRATSATATACAGSSGSWQHWIVRTGAGNVVRRGIVNTFSGAMVVQSTLTADQVMFGSDGLARTGGALVNDNQISICSRRTADRNARRVVLGAGSRMSTQSFSSGC
jgi:type IV fimbrial biogenesis protein FimT